MSGELTSQAVERAYKRARREVEKLAAAASSNALESAEQPQLFPTDNYIVVKRRRKGEDHG